MLRGVAAADVLVALVGTEDAEFLDFMYRLLQYTPSSRMSVAEALAHSLWMISQAIQGMG